MTDLSKLVSQDEGQALLDRALSEAKQEFGSFFLSRLIGMKISCERDTCVVAFDTHRAFFNPQGSLHGGILATAMDISMGHLLRHVSGAGLTLEMKVQYLAPVASGPVRCIGSFLKRGRLLAFLKSEAFDQAGNAVAYSTSTWKILPAKA